MYGNNRVADDYWSMTPKQRADLARYRKEMFFYDRLYKDREKGFFHPKGWEAWGRHTLDWVEEQFEPLSRLKVGFSGAGAGLAGAATIAAAFAIPGVGLLAGGALAIAAATGGGFLTGTRFEGPTSAEVEALGMRRMAGARTRLVDTTAAQTMRQRMLSAMHNSVYSLRGALGNEASMMHR